GGQRRPQSDLWRGRPQGRGASDRLPGRSVWAAAGGRFPEAAARHAPVQRPRRTGRAAAARRGAGPEGGWVVADREEGGARVLAEEVAPALAMDGNAVEVLDVSEGIVQVRLTGVCGSCPSSIYAVLMGIEQELRRRVPEVAYLEAVP